jgi:hypothetical protein
VQALEAQVAGLQEHIARQQRQLEVVEGHLEMRDNEHRHRVLHHLRDDVLELKAGVAHLEASNYFHNSAWPRPCPHIKVTTHWHGREQGAPRIMR